MSVLTILQIAEQIDGEVVGDGSLSITGIAAAANAGNGDLTFAEKESFLGEAEQSQASAILVPLGFESSLKVLIRVKNPRLAMTRVLALFFPPELPAPGIHASAVIDPTAQIDPSAHIGPHCVIGPGVRLGRNSTLSGNNHLGRDSRLGDRVFLHPGVIIYDKSQIGDRVIIHAGAVIGSDGYGYVFDQGRHHKMLQIGNVVIGNDVEIGANTAIDRAALGSTIIGPGTKIDNLVHVAHNVVMGSHCLIMGQTGFAGSTHLGDYVVVASQAGIAGHLKIGAQAKIGAKSGVMRDVAPGEVVLGSPAGPHLQIKRQWIALAKLPESLQRLRALETRFDPA